MGQVRKRDSNEAAIVAALEAIGCVVFQLSIAGCGDLLVWRQREGWHVLEVKQLCGRLTAGQVATHARVPICVVRSVEDALALFGVRA